MKIYFFVFLSLITVQNFAQIPQDKISKKLKSTLENKSDNELILVWVYFVDKGKNTDIILQEPKNIVSEKSLKRRSKLLAKNSLIDFTDLPVNDEYITLLNDQGFKLKQRSKWLNAVSGYVDKKLINHISKIDFVKKMDIVSRFIHKKNDSFNAVADSINKLQFKSENTFTLNYGPSYNQLSISNIPQVHDLGYNGQGVTICVMDAGFANLNHEVFSNMNIAAMYDFVADTPVMGAHPHGTATLSLIGGFKEGQLIGPAYGATFLLARTENDPGSETPIEEDNWVAAMEWADSIGVDVTSTSLGYLSFDAPYISYTWEDMDGNTAVITIAADLAVSKGIVVVNSAGNNGFNADHNTLGAPADGDSVITVGSVDYLGNRASYSSVGPTVDDRIKPDVMAVGMGSYIATPSSVSSYTTSISGGTSYACPIAAGVAAILLSINPSLTPMEIREIFRQTSLNSSNPNNLIGWGVINAFAAANLLLTDVQEKEIPDQFYMLSNYPNPFNPTTTIRYSIAEAGNVKIKLFDILGNEIQTLLDQKSSAGTHEILLNGSNLSSGIYLVQMVTAGNMSTLKISLIK